MNANKCVFAAVTLIFGLSVCFVSSTSADDATDAATSPYEVILTKQHLVDKTDPPGIARVLEYTSRGPDQKHYWNTNVAFNWRGIWAEDSNSWRVLLKTHKTNSPDICMTVHVGSISVNSGSGLLPAPDGKYAELKLLDLDGKIVSARKGAAEQLYEEKNAVMAQAEKERVNVHPPSADDSSIERHYPDTISDLEYPRWERGTFLNFAGFVSNGPPCQIGIIKFNSIFSIEMESDYTLIVQPVLFRMHYDGGTFQGYLDRVDLPSVTTKIHLVPNHE